MRSPHKQLQLRLPPDLKDWIAAQAEKNGCSQNSEIIRAVRDRMDRLEQRQPE
ncbi:Arc family DNA-binding protein [Marinibacterium sp. SX1]|uniref:Arc family DNA-binding protein n=1 Tax=Marinibacterium sp. SX1 TaxID=3388424 RepID=UPI003D178D56